jgi:hypothetical protein
MYPQTVDALTEWLRSYALLVRETSNSRMAQLIQYFLDPSESAGGNLGIPADMLSSSTVDVISATQPTYSNPHRHEFLPFSIPRYVYPEEQPLTPVWSLAPFTYATVYHNILKQKMWTDHKVGGRWIYPETVSLGIKGSLMERFFKTLVPHNYLGYNAGKGVPNDMETLTLHLGQSMGMSWSYASPWEELAVIMNMSTEHQRSIMVMFSSMFLIYKRDVQDSKGGIDIVSDHSLLPPTIYGVGSAQFIRQNALSKDQLKVVNKIVDERFSSSGPNQSFVDPGFAASTDNDGSVWVFIPIVSVPAPAPVSFTPYVIERGSMIKVPVLQTVLSAAMADSAYLGQESTETEAVTLDAVLEAISTNIADNIEWQDVVGWSLYASVLPHLVFSYQGSSTDFNISALQHQEMLVKYRTGQTANNHGMVMIASIDPDLIMIEETDILNFVSDSGAPSEAKDPLMFAGAAPSHTTPSSQVEEGQNAIVEVPAAGPGVAAATESPVVEPTSGEVVVEEAAASTVPAPVTSEASPDALEELSPKKKKKKDKDGNIIDDVEEK